MSLAAEPYTPDPVQPVLTLEEKVDAIYQFCAKMAELMEQIGNNPMIQAMMPPGMFD